MTQQDKAFYYRELKAAGVEFTKHYRDYKEHELEEAYRKLTAESIEAPDFNPDAMNEAYAQLLSETREPEMGQETGVTRPAVPVRDRDPNEMAGQRLNTQPADEPIRVDEQGREWFQEEVLKPAYPKPRGRRVLKYNDPGVVKKTIKEGEYEETFEVGGAERRPSEVKITLPSYQVGIYKDRRFPFRTICYNGREGFHREDVENYYHGAELVPSECKRIYVENVLCYDVRTVIRAITEEYNRLILTKQIQPPPAPQQQRASARA